MVKTHNERKRQHRHEKDATRKASGDSDDVFVLRMRRSDVRDIVHSRSSSTGKTGSRVSMGDDSGCVQGVCTPLSVDGSSMTAITTKAGYFDLPPSVLAHVFGFDPTYHEVYDRVMTEIPSHLRVQCEFEDHEYAIHSIRRIHYHINLVCNGSVQLLDEGTACLDCLTEMVSNSLYDTHAENMFSIDVDSLDCIVRTCSDISDMLNYRGGIEFLLLPFFLNVNLLVDPEECELEDEEDSYLTAYGYNIHYGNRNGYTNYFDLYEF